MWNRVDLKLRAKAAMRNNYGACVAVALVCQIVTLIFSGSSGFRLNINQSDMKRVEYYVENLDARQLAIITAVMATIGVIAIIGTVAKVFVQSALEVGGCRFFIENQTERAPFGRVLYGFECGNYGNIVLTIFLRDLYIFLWSLLLVIPGIVKRYEYLMVPYILAENPSMDRRDAFALSREMMDGQKLDAFILELSFIGWNILSAFTCGILTILYVNPYVKATLAELYTFNRQVALEKGLIR